MRRVLTLSVLLLFAMAQNGWSFTCYFTLAKDSCWTHYDVSVNVVDQMTSKTVLTLTIPKGNSWSRGSFDCTPEQGLYYVAKFSPIFWKNDQNKVFYSLRHWFLPESIQPADVAWTINVCYASDFSQVPLPPNAVGNCACDFSKIPAP